MTIHLIKKETVENFCFFNAQSRDSFEEWLNKLKYADWVTTYDMRQTFPSIDFLGNGSSRVVFDIGGNKYRLIAKYAFGENQVHLFICWMGTHANYSKLCESNNQFNINLY